MSIHIIGGGIIGLLAARELTQTGCPVVVLDRRQLGQESSWAGGGILSPLYPWRYPDAITALAHWGQLRYGEMIPSLLESTGIDAEWLQSGLLISPDSDVDRQSAIRWAHSHAINLTALTSEQASAYEPALSHFGPGLWLPEIAQIRPPRLIAALKRELVLKGGEIREYCEVRGLLVKGGRLAGIRTETGDISTDRCLVTAGAWTGKLLQESGLKLPIYPVRGQMLLLRAQPGDLSRMVLKCGHYLIPRRDGRVLIGSTIEEAGFDSATTESARSELWNAALALAPSLAQYRIERQWAGLRPGTPNGVPFIDEHPRIRGLFVCAGHFRNGFVLGPASARLAVDLLLKRDGLFDPTPYRIPHTEDQY